MTWARRNSWWLFLVVTSLLLAAYYLTPLVVPQQSEVDRIDGVIWAVTVLVTVAAMAFAIAALGLPLRRAWVLFTAGVALTGAADILWEFPHLVGIDGELPYPSVLDLLYLLSYVCLFAGILALVRGRQPQHDRAALLDALIITTAAALTSWIFIIAPSLDQSAEGTLTAALVTAAYPMMDILLLGAAARLWFSVDAGRNTSMRFIVVTLVAILVSDTAYTYFSITQNWSDGTVWDLGWFLFYMGMGAAALHPSATAPATVTAPERAVTKWRFVMLMALMSILPLVLLVGQLASGSRVDGIVILVGTLLMFGMVLMRLNDLVQQLRETLRRERVIRDANGALAAASELEAIRTTVVTAAADLHQGASSYIVGLRRGGASALVTQTVPDGLRLGLGDDSLRQLLDSSLPFTATTGPTPLHHDLGLSTSTALTVHPLTDSEGVTDGFLVVAGNPDLPSETPQAVAALAEAASLANARVGLGRVLAERASEQRLRRMLQHSTDIIAVLDLDLTIRYLSPGAERLLGAAPQHVLGTSWLDAVFPADRVAANELIETATSARPAHAEFRLLAGDGSHRYVDVVASRVIDHDEPGFVLTCHDVTERRALEQQLSYQAFHDSLTGLANRALFRDRLEHAIARTSRTSARFAVLFIDLDDFKDVNDSLGHAAGDALLRQMTSRLLEEVRDEDTVARLGGDEFAILLESITDDDTEVEAIAKRIVRSAREPFELGSSPITTGLSVGIAVGDGSSGTAEAVMRNADLALYEAKNLGKNRHAVFAPAMHEQALDRLQLTADLRTAVTDDQLVLHYQPIIELATGRIVGAEALVRWEHPTRGLLGPVQFIGLAEESGLIVPLGNHVLAQALRTAGAWHRDIPGCSELTVTVNLSARQLLEETLVDEVQDALDAADVPAGRLVLEITESMLLPDEGVSVDRLRALADLGVRLYIDDFGTGYSSLSYLQQLPVHGIKLAREFVTTLRPGTAEADGTTLVSTIRSIAETLGLSSIVAEGIETAEQRAALMELGYTHGQGYLLARPMPAGELAVMLHEQQEPSRRSALADAGV